MRFLQATEQGKNGPWRYAVGVVIILVFWLILGSAPLLVASAWAQLDADPATRLDPSTGILEGVDPLWGGYLLPNLTYPFFLVGLWTAVRLCHKRSLRSLVTPAPAVNWRRLIEGFGLWFVLVAVTTGLEVALYPREFVWADVPLVRYLVFTLLALALTPLQAFTEELFFRGYVLQGVGRWFGADRGWLGRWSAIALNGALFAFLHILNPEVARAPVLFMVYFLTMGMVFSWVTLRDGSAELVLGAHAANNLFIALFVNYEGSVLQTPALVMTTRLDPLYNLVTLAVSSLIFVCLAVRTRRNRADGDVLLKGVE